MKKILMRGAISQNMDHSLIDIIVDDKIGQNSGNVIYLAGTFRSLFTEDVEIVMDEYDGEFGRFTEEDIARINEEYDAYIIPLADAFRSSFAKKLSKLAKLVRKLTIPCVVVGVGLSNPYEPNLSRDYPFDEAVREFMSAILEKSSKVGLRGAITGEYLKKLGFIPEQHFTVIGCPSMYCFGKHIERRELKLTDDSLISVNISPYAPSGDKKYLLGILEQYKNSLYVGQRMYELQTLYYGMPSQYADDPLFPGRIQDMPYSTDQARYFVDAPSWFDYMHKVDLSFGNRLHGNVAAVLGGAPVLFVPKDARMRELVEYHDFPNVGYNTLKKNIPLEELIAKTDMDSHIRRHSANFDHFIDFLDENGVDHIYSSDRDRVTAPTDSLNQIKHGELTSILRCSPVEAAERWNEYHQRVVAKNEKKIESLKNANDELKSEKKRLTEEINSSFASKVKKTLRKL